jgi:hypothetical protein
MQHANREALRQIPYLNVDAIEDRMVKLMPLWDGERWHDWVPVEDRIIPIKIVDALEADYIAVAPARETDIVIPFVEVMWQRASWPHVSRFISAISADFHNLGTAIDKMDHFFRFRDAIGTAVTDFVTTELEYLFVLSRSIFDLLQEAIATIWTTKIELLDEEADAKRRRHGPPRTFSGMVLRGEEIRPKEELVDLYALPQALAATYEEIAPFFRDTRRFRDAVVHGGKDQRWMYSTDKGFCVPKEFRELYGIQIPAPDHFHNENLVSLLPLVAHLVVGTIGACNAVAQSFARQLRLPPEIAPGHRVFVRDPHNEALAWMQSVRDGGSPWWSDRPPVRTVTPTHS